jgi:hypothetical protein
MANTQRGNFRKALTVQARRRRVEPIARRRDVAVTSTAGVPTNEQAQETVMARKPATRPEFVLFDVFYEDGSQRSNRRVPIEILGGLDGDAPARAAIEEQDRLIAERSSKPNSAVTSIRRSSGK